MLSCAETPRAVLAAGIIQISAESYRARARIQTVHGLWKRLGFGCYAVAGARCLSRSSAS